LFKLIFLLILLLFLTGCWDIIITVRITPSGKTYVRLTHKTQLCYLIRDLGSGLRSDGFANVKKWQKGDYCYVSGEKWGDAVTDFKFGDLMDVQVKGNKDTGIFKNNYTFKWYIGEYDREVAREKGLSRDLLKQIKVHFKISLPGEIQETSGWLSKDKKTAHFSYSLYALNTGKRKILVKSSQGKFSDYLSAQSKADALIAAKQRELNNIKSRLNDVSYKIDREKRFQQQKQTFFNRANRDIVLLMNKFVKVFHKKKGRYPETGGELMVFLEENDIDPDQLPAPEPEAVYRLNYQMDKHKYKLLKTQQEN